MTDAIYNTYILPNNIIIINPCCRPGSAVSIPYVTFCISNTTFKSTLFTSKFINLDAFQGYPLELLSFLTIRNSRLL